MRDPALVLGPVLVRAVDAAHPEDRRRDAVGVRPVEDVLVGGALRAAVRASGTRAAAPRRCRGASPVGAARSAAVVARAPTSSSAPYTLFVEVKSTAAARPARAPPRARSSVPRAFTSKSCDGIDEARWSPRPAPRSGTPADAPRTARAHRRRDRGRRRRCGSSAVAVLARGASAGSAPRPGARGCRGCRTRLAVGSSRSARFVPMKPGAAGDEREPGGATWRVFIRESPRAASSALASRRRGRARPAPRATRRAPRARPRTSTRGS